MTQAELAAWAAKIIGGGKNEAGEIEFVKTDAAETKANILALYEAITGRTLARADPVRLFLEVIAYVVILLKAAINYTGKMNLLKYAVGNYLEDIGELVGTERLLASAATTTISISLSACRAQNTIIPAGTRITADSKFFFAIESDVVIPSGETSSQARAVCTVEGAVGNGYAAGEINQIVDPVPFVASIVNLTQSEGGSDIEADDPYRARIQEAPEGFSAAGPDGAYRYHAMRASALIADVSVDSPRPGEVEVRPLLAGGQLPGKEILDLVAGILNDRKIRPLTDKLSVLAPEPVAYNIDLTYWIDREDVTRAAAIQSAVEKAMTDYEFWQKVKLGRDINPSELIYRIRAAGAKRAEVREPVFKVTTKAQVAVAESKIALFGGLEDG